MYDVLLAVGRDWHGYSNALDLVLSPLWPQTMVTNGETPQSETLASLATFLRKQLQVSLPLTYLVTSNFVFLTLQETLESQVQLDVSQGFPLRKINAKKNIF